VNALQPKALPMKLAVLSDIHGNLLALQAVVADLQYRSIDQVVNLGDHASGPLWPQETLRFLMGQPWIHIAGNHDRNLGQKPPEGMGLSDRYAYKYTGLAEKTWLQGLPSQLHLELAGSTILLCHGAPDDENQYLLETVESGRARLATLDEIHSRLKGYQASLILCGHTHLQRVISVGAEMLMVNPGSVGLAAYTDTSPEPHTIEAGSPHARYALVEWTPQDWQVEMLAIPYDHVSAAEQAHKNNRPEWESGLRTGFIQMAGSSNPHTASNSNQRSLAALEAANWGRRSNLHGHNRNGSSNRAGVYDVEQVKEAGRKPESKAGCAP
jgi:putative phosphoesterase